MILDQGFPKWAKWPPWGPQAAKSPEGGMRSYTYCGVADEEKKKRS